MANILIIDLREQSGYFLRSLFRGQQHKAMIAIDDAYAYQLLNTGLFDVLVVDATVEEPAVNSIIEYAELWLPLMPIVAVAGLKSRETLDRKRFCAVIERPLNGRQINTAMAQAFTQLREQWINRRAAQRFAESVPVLIKLDELPTPAQGRDISPDGVALEMSKDTTIAENQTVPAILQFPDEAVEFQGRVAFVKNDGEAKVIGINFVNPEEEKQRKISKFIKKAA